MSPYHDKSYGMVNIWARILTDDDKRGTDRSSGAVRIIRHYERYIEGRGSIDMWIGDGPGRKKESTTQSSCWSQVDQSDRAQLLSYYHHTSFFTS